jgi:DNA-binding NtrC family response regulator
MPTNVQTEYGVKSYAAESLAGDSAAMHLLRLQVSRIAPHFRTALVTGERGTGKEGIAREIHRISGAEGPFSSLEVDVFAENRAPVELRGVLYLKGLDRLEPALQERLVERLRVIQRETRILVASECDLRGMLATGRLRQNLASRVGSLEIRVSPLRDRIEDLEAVAASMLRRANARGWLSEDALDALRAHSWPGNLAELWTVMCHVARVLGAIGTADLPELVPSVASDTGVRLDHVMQRHVFEVLQRCSGNKVRAAEMLGISRSTLYRMLEAAGDSVAG